jgi:shikimate 5-dehydrogenase
MDTVYRPVETVLVRVARAAGCPAVLGTEMYAVQAAGQIRAWTGASPPEGLIERILVGVFASPSHP